MESLSVPIIVIICYLIGEIYKVVYKDKSELYKLIPIILSLVGGVIGVLMYVTNKEMIFNASNVWVALEIGIVSGASSTGANQIIKQILKKEKEIIKNGRI